MAILPSSETIPRRSERPLRTADRNKQETQKQWNENPCGAETVREAIGPGSLSFYREARRHRYTTYGPWFDSVIRFDEVRNQRVLEIGVGLGSDHFRFAANHNTMTAVDLTREHLRHTQRHLALEGLSTEAVFGDAEQLPFDDDCFDVVYTFGVLHHTTDIRSALVEIRRVLRPGGLALVGLYHRDSYYFWIQKVLVEGLLKAGFLRRGYRGVMSTVEFRHHTESATPLVQVFSRAQVRRLFRDWRSVAIETCHVELNHFHRLGHLLRGLDRAGLERRFGTGGWYVVARATK
ncbi:MAG TPA: class I SAM-dependent methyltransferase [Candidatus Binatia bacterium]|nr:class I SAM-dependent methyltransferase [Candidatus Binatia bacterium]